MYSGATSVSAYLAALAPDRRKTISTVRSVVRRHLPKGYKERMAFGMITYELPLRAYPHTHHGQPLCFAGLASQKNHCALYLMNIYADSAPARLLADGFKKAGKKLDVGKSCVRFKTLDDLPLDVIGRVIAATPPKAFIALYEAGQRKPRQTKS